jgi:dTDP-4-dehydrorhamnose 3,5-epimerase
MAPGFAHGFCVLSEFADLPDKVSRLYDHADEGGLIWNDRDLTINMNEKLLRESCRRSALQGDGQG